MIVADDPESHYTLVDTGPVSLTDSAEIVVEVVREASPNTPLPVRAVVTDENGHHVDGAGRGTYDDGRFFAEDRFTVQVPAGSTHVALSKGPNYVPLETWLTVEAGRRFRLTAYLHQWFAPEERGWYDGDNHVHAQHDQEATIETSLGYASLQARANGLSYITEAGSDTLSYETLEKLSTDRFLLRFAPELGLAPFVGHMNSPGIKQPIPSQRYKQLFRQPLPVQAIREEVHRRGGVLIHTHPLTPPRQLHWMGAAEVFPDAVLGETVDALDLDNDATQALWFAVLNLGNNVAVSSYTDATLERRGTLSPGDRRVYAQADSLSYPAIVEAIRHGRTFATNGGPLFPFLRLGDHAVGDTVRLEEATNLPLQVEVHSRQPLRRMVLYRNGQVARTFDVEGEKGSVSSTYQLSAPAERSWYVLRVESDGGHWAVTSPIYVEPRQPAHRPFASALLLEISNATRLVQLRRDYFAHLVVSVSPEDRLESVTLLRDGQPIQRFAPARGDALYKNRTPVTEPGWWGESNVEYGRGWMWHPDPSRAVHLQADWPVEESGWYALRATTSEGRILRSDALYFDAKNANSQQISLAQLAGKETHFSLHGYGEGMPLSDIHPPFGGDHWWYRENTYYQITARFGGETRRFGRDDGHPLAKKFRGRQ